MKFNINTNRPTQHNWTNIVETYKARCSFFTNDDDDACIRNLPQNVNRFLSAEVPWKYQRLNVKNLRNANTNNNTKLHMVRVWATIGDAYYMESVGGGSMTVAEPYEITGLYYNDGKVIIWNPNIPPEKAKLSTKWIDEWYQGQWNWNDENIDDVENIDDAHLDVVLFNMPRTIITDHTNTPFTVQGTVRQVLNTLHRFQNGNYIYGGLLRTVPQVRDKSTTYTYNHSGIGRTMSPERAKWQQKMKDIVGIEGQMNYLAQGEARGPVTRLSAYNDPEALKSERPENRAASIAARRKNLNAYIQNRYKNYTKVNLGNGLVLNEKPSANTLLSNDRLRSKKKWNDAFQNTRVFSKFSTYQWKPLENSTSTKYQCTLQNNYWSKDCPRYLRDIRNDYLKKALQKVDEYSQQASKITNINVPKVSATNLNTKNVRELFSAGNIMEREGLEDYYYDAVFKFKRPNCNEENMYWNKECPQFIRKARNLKNKDTKRK